MLKRISIISLGAAIVLAPLTALTPVAALAQTTALAASAPPAGAHKSQKRHTSNVSTESARTSANSPVTMSLFDQTASGATMTTSIAVSPPMTEMTAIARG
jgi:hypothetical protein